MLSCSGPELLALESEELSGRPSSRRPHWIQYRLISGCDRLQVGQICILAHSLHAIYIHGNALKMLVGTLEVVIDSERKDDGIINGLKSKASGLVGIEIERRIVVPHFSEA